MRLPTNRTSRRAGSYPSSFKRLPWFSLGRRGARAGRGTVYVPGALPGEMAAMARRGDGDRPVRFRGFDLAVSPEMGGAFQRCGLARPPRIASRDQTGATPLTDAPGACGKPPGSTVHEAACIVASRAGRHPNSGRRPAS